MEDLGQKSLDLHKQFGGKLEVKSKVPLKNRHDLALAYTPGVAAVSKAIAADSALAKIYTIKKNCVAVITDGSAVLGLRNIGGLAALPVMEGKCALFKELANIDAFPICLDTQDVEEIISTIKNIAPVFGGINLEDFSAPRCFEIEERLKKELDIPVMHDDQHGTAVVVLAGLINVLKLKKQTSENIKIVISGAGAAGTAITKLIIEYGIQNIVVCDSQGIIGNHRKDLKGNKQDLANLTKCDKQGGLPDALKSADIFIGVSAPNILTSEMIKAMAKDPVIFALSNPVPEVEPQVAKEAGAFIVATGRADLPNQLNNSLVFPGVFRGALDNKVRQITQDMLIKAAENLAACVKDLSPENIIPDPLDKSAVAAVASAIV